jgi:predicted rRNA methylase
MTRLSKRPPPKKGVSNSDGVFIVEGKGPLVEYLSYSPKRVISLHCTKPFFTEFNAKANELGINCLLESGPRTLGESQANLWAKVKLECMRFEDLEKELESNPNEQTILAIDHISDPRNLGAIVRSAAFFGVKYIIVPERRQVLLTQSGVSTAQGGFALSNLVVVTNLGRALDDLKKSGFWILGTDMGGDTNIEKIGQDFQKRVLVMGSEDKGISEHIQKRCDHTLAIPGSGTLESLNVSVATGILLYSLFRSSDLTKKLSTR